MKPKTTKVSENDIRACDGNPIMGIGYNDRARTIPGHKTGAMGQTVPPRSRSSTPMNGRVKENFGGDPY
jgi:hypothetical protein